MAQIRILPDRVANQIAAGEVVERPAAVVKELVENALDAGATRIEVEFRQGGRVLIRVEDDGSGMARDEAMLALERHATSKIAEVADLDRLSTYGFRGEALPSVASVSRLTLQTRAAGAEVGTEIVVNGGKLLLVRECGRPVGTQIAVEQLFHPVPARRKFLKSDATEAGHIAQAVRLYALASPGVAFSLIEDGRVIFRSPPCASLAERVGEIFGTALLDSLVAIEAAEADLRLTGLVGRPGFGRGSRHDLITFVNTRPVDSRVLNSALSESYRESLPPGRHPVAFLFFRCDPAAVDVNVHPAKREVRFRNEAQVRGFVIRSVLERLRELGTAAAPQPAEPPAKPTPGWPYSGRTAFTLVEPVPARMLAESAPVPARLADPIAAKPPPAASRWRWLGLAHGAYAVFETSAGLVLLDRRAAHERIWFERLQAQFRAGELRSQRLLLPPAIELDPIASALLLDRTEFLGRHGFEIAAFGRNFFRLLAVPDWMEPADAEPFLRDLLGAFREGRRTGETLEDAREGLARLAASRAVRISARSDEREMQALLVDLFATHAPLTSPSGRPTFVELNFGELARRFQKG